MRKFSALESMTYNSEVTTADTVVLLATESLSKSANTSSGAEVDTAGNGG